MYFFDNIVFLKYWNQMKNRMPTQPNDGLLKKAK